METSKTIPPFVAAPGMHEIPARIQIQIETAYAWYCQQFYPEK